MIEILKPVWDMVNDRAEELKVDPKRLFGYSVLKKVEDILSGIDIDELNGKTD